MNTKVAKKLTTKSALRTGLAMQYVSWFCISQRCATAQRLFVNKALLLTVQQLHDEIFLSNGTACRQGGKELVLFLLHVFVSTSSLCIIFFNRQLSLFVRTRHCSKNVRAISLLRNSHIWTSADFLEVLLPQIASIVGLCLTVVSGKKHRKTCMLQIIKTEWCYYLLITGIIWVITVERLCLRSWHSGSQWNLPMLFPSFLWLTAVLSNIKKLWNWKNIKLTKWVTSITELLCAMTEANYSILGYNCRKHSELGGRQELLGAGSRPAELQ